MHQRLAPAEMPPADQVQRWVADLDSGQFAKREKAFNELKSLRKRVEPELLQALAKKPALEVQRRLERLVQELRSDEVAVGPGDALRMMRVIRLLESLATPGARRLLERLAKGAARASETQTARSALQRLAQTEGR